MSLAEPGSFDGVTIPPLAARRHGDGPVEIPSRSYVSAPEANAMLFDETQRQLVADVLSQTRVDSGGGLVVVSATDVKAR